MPCLPVSTLTAGHCPRGDSPAVPTATATLCLTSATTSGLHCPHSVPPPRGALHPTPGVGSLSWPLAEDKDIDMPVV